MNYHDKHVFDFGWPCGLHYARGSKDFIRADRRLCPTKGNHPTEAGFSSLVFEMPK